MEFTAGGRLEVRITPSDVGRRVSVRRLDDSGRGTFADTVGVLVSWSDGVLSITRRTGETVRVAERSLVAGKVVPAAPARRRGPAADFAELARVRARAWWPAESEPLGQWTLRAAPASALRAGSALPLGDPGTPLDDALARVRAWYGERGLPARVEAATGAEGTQEELCAALEERGWWREASAEVRIGGLAAVADRADADRADGTGRAALSRTPGAAWHRRGWAAGAGLHETPAPGTSVWFAALTGGDGEPVAVGRCVVDGRWAGFTGVAVDPAHRRRGLASAVAAALAARALEEGASAAWAQVPAGDGAARGLCDGTGLAVHHHCHHFRAA
ncbi:GNAT family N-acetyltransferase [Streptomyces sudanensis]|nr:GNAT family N-acetyltransferase [Streptomyces sudanensis]MCP9957469.1 GNAT family N-acetyltransferase [Streptomyces sudanensis]MCQ0001987.1 GNAT family N-acetyltransferase [Streptomyces sudanensis]